MFKFWLFLHVFSVIVAYGPTYAFPLTVGLARKDPKHVPFAAKVNETISMKMTWPFSILAGLTGIAMILTERDVYFDSFFETRWLVSGVALYVIGVTFSATVQTPRAKKMMELTSKMAAAGPPPEGAPAGPPPEMVALGKKLQMGGMFLGVLVLVIVILMVTKPTL